MFCNCFSSFNLIKLLLRTLEVTSLDSLHDLVLNIHELMKNNDTFYQTLFPHNMSTGKWLPLVKENY